MTSTEDILLLLPSIYRDAARQGSPLAAIIAAMSELVEPIERKWMSIDQVVDPRRAPDDFIPFLASWLSIDRLFQDRQFTRTGHVGKKAEISTGIGRLRELVATASELARLRGTKKGLVKFLETATGEEGFWVEDDVRTDSGDICSFYFRLHAPLSLKTHAKLIRAIVESEKPAYVTYELIYIEEES